MLKDHVLLLYIATMFSPFLWLIFPHQIATNVKLYYRHILMVIITLISLAAYRYNYPLVI